MRSHMFLLANGKLQQTHAIFFANWVPNLGSDHCHRAPAGTTSGNKRATATHGSPMCKSHAAAKSYQHMDTEWPPSEDLAFQRSLAGDDAPLRSQKMLHMGNNHIADEHLKNSKKQKNKKIKKKNKNQRPIQGVLATKGGF